MNNALRSMERQLVCQRLQVLAAPVAEAFAETWDRALISGEPLPDELDLARSLAKEEVPLLAATPLFSYLMQCRKDKRTPDPDRMVLTIVHGFGEMRYPLSKHCRCPAKMALAAPGTNLLKE